MLNRIEFLKQFFLVIVSVVFALAVSEGIARKLLSLHTSEVTFKGDAVGGISADFTLSDDPVLLYEWKSMPQELIVKKENTYRILILGDSITYRKMGSLQDYYPKVLEDLLNAKYDGNKYEVINAGVPGYNTIQEVRYLKKRFISFAFDLVVVGYCAANDRTIKRKIKQYQDGIYCSDIRESYPYIPLFSFGLNDFLMKRSYFYRFINYVLVKIAEKKKVSFLLHRVENFDLTSETEGAIQELCDLALQRRFQLAFVIFPLLADGSESECEWIIKICEKYKIPHLDLRASFEERGYENIRISEADFYHPNKAGQRLAAKEIFGFLKYNFKML